VVEEKTLTEKDLECFRGSGHNPKRRHPTTELGVALQEYLRNAGIDWNEDLLRVGMTVLFQLLS